MTMAAHETEPTLTERIDAARASGVLLGDQDVQRLQELASQRAAVLRKVRHPADSRVDGLSRSFHLGTVGGSGRGVGPLNRRRGRLIERTIDAAVRNVPLYQNAKSLSAAMERILNGQDTHAARCARSDRKETADAQLAARCAVLAKGDRLIRWTVTAVYRDRDGYPSKLAYRDDDGQRQTLPIVKALFQGNAARYRALIDAARRRPLDPQGKYDE